MGKSKHGKDSSYAKAQKKYKESNRLLMNKKRIADRIAAGKKVKSKKKPYSRFHAMDIMIANVIPIAVEGVQIVKKPKKKKKVKKSLNSN